MAGGVIGSALGHVLPNSLKEHLPTLFGMCSIAIGINSIIKAGQHDSGRAGDSGGVYHRAPAAP